MPISFLYFIDSKCEIEFVVRCNDAVANTIAGKIAAELQLVDGRARFSSSIYSIAEMLEIAGDNKDCETFVTAIPTKHNTVDNFDIFRYGGNYVWHFE